MAASRTIPDRGEFVDVLDALRRGHVLIRLGESSDGCWLAGHCVFWSYEPLRSYGLIDEFHNPDGFERVHYFRLNERGMAFAASACAAWKRRPLLERIALRLIG